MANQQEPLFVLVDDEDRVAQLRQRRGPERRFISLIHWTPNIQKAAVMGRIKWKKVLAALEPHQKLPYFQYHEVVYKIHFKEDLEAEQQRV